MKGSFRHQPSPSGPTLPGRLREELAVRHDAARTIKSYVQWVRRYLAFHGRRHPGEMGAPEIHAFLSHLATDLVVSASTQNQAVSALLFLYRQVLEKDVGELTGIARARQWRRIPTVLTPREVKAVLDRLDGVEALVAHQLYGSGLRLIGAPATAGQGSGPGEASDHRPLRQRGRSTEGRCCPRSWWTRCGTI